jgi:formylglycine-generating enzyme required for sulfatase activity
VAAWFFALGIVPVCANNIRVTNTSLSPAGRVKFDISWENSWRTNSPPSNWDAAWVFVKFYDADSGYWRHAHLGNDHSVPSGVGVDAGWVYPGFAASDTNWVAGVFLYRTISIAGTDTLVATGVELDWEYAQDGTCYDAIDSVKVFAIEMAYVRQEAFYLGSGGAEEGHFYTYPTVSSTYLVNNEGEIPIGQADGSLYYPDSVEANDHFGDYSGPVPAAFPKGYQDFYIMKYEIAQQDYVDFLNTLSRIQQNARTQTDLAPGVTSVVNRYVMRNNSVFSERQGIRCDAVIDAVEPVTFYCDMNTNGIGGEADDGQWVACNWLSWPDVMAYLDWCGLRPMTELEFVKAARGPVSPVVEEYVWGTTVVAQAGPGILNEGAINETSGTSGANAVYGNLVGGGMRTGIFAADGTGRAQAGAGYYGAMDLSGDLWDRVVTLGRPLGRAFEGTLGNGQLNSSGNSDVRTWPPDSYAGSGLLGGNWYQEAEYMRTSDRNTAAHTPAGRSRVSGGRGVRNAP